MKKHYKKIIVLIVGLLMVFTLSSCSDDADVVSENLSKDADNFKVARRVVFFNGITDQYLLTIEGFCSIEDDGSKLAVTCKLGDGQYKKHFLGLSDNVSYFIEQTESANVSDDFYKVTFKPTTIIPDVDAR